MSNTHSSGVAADQDKSGTQTSPPPQRSLLARTFGSLGRGIRNDIKARAPYYISDWTDAYNYRVVPATILIFFSNVLPGIAFSLDLIETTGKYGVAEVLVSSVMAAAIFSIFGAQPLCIAGVTGPITVLNKVIYDITQGGENPPDYLQFVGWVYLWGAIMHWVTAVLNWCDFLRYVTLFPCDTFGFYVSWVYLQYGVQVLTRQFPHPPVAASEQNAGALVSIILALLMLGTATALEALARTDAFHRHVRRLLADYGMPVALIASTGVAYWGRLNAANPDTLPVGHAFQAAGGRPWLVRFWELDSHWVGIALPFGAALYILFFFDHNVSSLMAQGSQFPLRKPPGFHWDFFLLGITTFIAGLLGVPAPNGLIPQAPIHTASLVIVGPAQKKIDKESATGLPLADMPRESAARQSEDDAPRPARMQARAVTVAAPEQRDETMEHPHHLHLPNDREPPPDPTLVHSSTGIDDVPLAVVEQRVSNLAQGALCLVLLTGPFLHVLALIPRGVLAGLFWYMGLGALAENGISAKLYYFFRDWRLVPASEPLRRVRPSRLALFVGVQLLGFAATFAITQTIAAIGFPLVIFLLVPVRMYVIPRLPFTPEELAILDGPTASPFTMASVGGTAT